MFIFVPMSMGHNSRSPDTESTSGVAARDKGGVGNDAAPGIEPTPQEPTRWQLGL